MAPAPRLARPGPANSSTSPPGSWLSIDVRSMKLEGAAAGVGAGAERGGALVKTVGMKEERGARTAAVARSVAAVASATLTVTGREVLAAALDAVRANSEPTVCWPLGGLAGPGPGPAPKTGPGPGLGPVATFLAWRFSRQRRSQAASSSGAPASTSRAMLSARRLGKMLAGVKGARQEGQQPRAPSARQW